MDLTYFPPNIPPAFVKVFASIQLQTHVFSIRYQNFLVFLDCRQVTKLITTKDSQNAKKYNKINNELFLTILIDKIRIFQERHL